MTPSGTGQDAELFVFDADRTGADNVGSHSGAAESGTAGGPGQPESVTVTLPAGCHGLLIALLAFGTSCAGPQAPAAPEPPSAGAAELLVGVREIPGTPSPQILRALPRLSLYEDGRAITPSGRTGALRTATVRRLTGERVRDLYQGRVCDGPYARRIAGGRRRGSACAHGCGSATYRRVTAGARGSRTALQADEIAEFRARTDPAKWLDTAFESGPRPYTPASLVIFCDAGRGRGCGVRRPAV